MPGLDSIDRLMAVVFVATIASGRVAVGGGPRISYAGFQIAFAFFICVIQGSSPAFDLTTASDRVIGVLFGILVAYLVSKSFLSVIAQSQLLQARNATSDAYSTALSAAATLALSTGALGAAPK
jgi:multidrug resistance protein MdtO